jgi:hypothetical protein
MRSNVCFTKPNIFEYITERIHAEENKRRTLQKNDIAAAISRSDIFDFLIDIFPRDEFKLSSYKESKVSEQCFIMNINYFIF